MTLQAYILGLSLILAEENVWTGGVPRGFSESVGF